MKNDRDMERCLKAAYDRIAKGAPLCRQIEGNVKGRRGMDAVLERGEQESGLYPASRNGKPSLFCGGSAAVEGESGGGRGVRVGVKPAQSMEGLYSVLLCHGRKKISGAHPAGTDGLDEGMPLP